LAFGSKRVRTYNAWLRTGGGGIPVLLTTLLITFDLDAFLEDALTSGARALVVLGFAFIGLQLLQRLLQPVVRVAIKEQMAGEPEIEVRKRTETLSHVIYRTTLAVVIVLVVLLLLPEFGLNAAPLIAGLGLVGLAVGFGAQNLVRDVINGVFILMENQYSRNDVVRIANISGLVEDINLRRTVLRDLDGTVHFIPHSQVGTASNLTKGFARVNFNVRVAYDSDLDRVFDVVDRVGKDLAVDPAFQHMVKDPPHALRVEQFSDLGIEVKVLGDTLPMDQWTVMGEMRRRLVRAFDEEGIVIPIPLQDGRFKDGSAAADPERAGEAR
jgi:moderate conductance mechanosensitive channel